MNIDQYPTPLADSQLASYDDGAVRIEHCTQVAQDFYKLSRKLERERAALREFVDLIVGTVDGGGNIITVQDFHLTEMKQALAATAPTQ